MTPVERRLIAAAPKVRRSLLAWYGKHRRDLPWRAEVSPYRTVVSELMLQQTQVATMLPYFARWVQRWPDFASLARADSGEVLAAWAGLGYYRRARLLHALAKEIAAAPALPRTAAEWIGFTGVGPYTAAAIASIAFGDPVAVVDGNVVRVLTRLAGLKSPFASSAVAVKRVTPLAGALLDPRRPGDHNQAVMELGAQVCRKAAPDCVRCPLAAHCASRGPGAAAIPRIARAKTRRAVVDRVLAVRRGKVLLRRHPSDATRLAGLAELPTAESVGLKLETDAKPHAIRRRSVTVTAYEERIHLLPAKARLPRSRDLIWVPIHDLPFSAVSGPHLRWIGELARNQTKG